MTQTLATLDGNEAAARIAHLVSEVIAIYPITPASPMGELADAWSVAGQTNLWGQVPKVIEMQSEGGAAGVVHGALQTGALTTTFTASQGLLLMVPNMYKIAGELTPAVFHIAARSLATHALSIFGDHSDVMAARQCGWALLASGSVQEAQDLAAVAHGATLKSRVPFLHFFDGFRTSHEVNTIALLDDADVASLIDERAIREFRARRLDPDAPVLRGTAQNPDVFFQAREAINPFYDELAGLVQGAMDALAERTGRQYRLFDYVGAPDAERVIVLMGSGIGAAEEAVRQLVAAGEKVGAVKVRLYRPFDTAAFVGALPRSVRRIAALDRTKEPGAVGEPLYQDVVTALAERWDEVHEGAPLPRVTGGRYGLSSKEFTPAMVAAVLAELDEARPKLHFTVGIHDDVGHTSLKWDSDFTTEPDDVHRAVFYGLGSDGSVGASKSSVKILGEKTPLLAQGYFVYDSRKAGAVTVSHLRISSRPVQSTYLITDAHFVACHQFHFLERIDVLEVAAPGATFLLNSPHGPGEVWDHLPVEVQRQIREKRLKLHVVDAHGVAKRVGLGGRINTVMQTCYLHLSELLPPGEAVGHVRDSVEKTYGRRGESVVRRNLEAVDGALSELHAVEVPAEANGHLAMLPPVPAEAPDFVQRVTAMMIAGKGDLLPVSAMPVDGTFPTGTSQWEKRSIAREIPIWDPDICTECGLCPLVCPHAAIRLKAYEPDAAQGAPDHWLSMATRFKELPDGWRSTIQVAPDDCTGCGVCVDVCPAKAKDRAGHKAINMEPKTPHLEREQDRYRFFLDLPEIDRTIVKRESLKGPQLLQPLFEYSGACAGCGETPYVKLLTQLFGDRLLVANATGCSSIYGGNLPTTPWSQDADGRGPAWSNSLFEDNAEFGLGMRLGADANQRLAASLVEGLHEHLGETLVSGLLDADQSDEAGILAQRARVDELRSRLASLESPEVARLRPIVDNLVKRSVWIVGGDGWAYDIGFGGLDHVLASGLDVNLLVLDTEVYSNTGGQASKATPRAAVAKFAAGGKEIGKKDLGMIAMAYGNVFVAQIAYGANPLQTTRAFLQAESWPGPSLIIAYSPCIAHGIDMSKSASHQKDAVNSAYWPLYRFDPRDGGVGQTPLRLDSKKPKLRVAEFAAKEARFAMLQRSDPDRARVLLDLAQRDVDARWKLYQAMAAIERETPETPETAETAETATEEVPE